MRTTILILTIFISATALAQNFTYPTINKQGSDPESFIPAGWKILDSTSGDLNADQRTDLAIIIQHSDSVTMVEAGDTIIAQPRMLIILFREIASEQYHLVQQSSHFIPMHNSPNMDDPYEDMTITKGVLNLRYNLFYHTGSWYTSKHAYKFRYKDQQFQLIGADYFSYHRASAEFEEYSYNFLTKKRSLTKGNEQKKTKQTRWSSIKLDQIKNLQDLEEPFTWEVEKDVFL